MKYTPFILLSIYLFGCSPYKQVSVTKSELMTKNWKGATEQSVLNSLGPYKSKTKLTEGYMLRYDYSYLNIPASTQASSVQIRASTQQGGIMTPHSSYSGDHRSPDDSVIRRMDFYFDQAHLVQSVMATGFQDSVYTVKRK